MRLENWKIYRWFKGGRWVLQRNQWWRVREDGFVDEPGYGYHYTFVGIDRREDYRSADEAYWADMKQNDRKLFDKHAPAKYQQHRVA